MEVKINFENRNGLIKKNYPGQFPRQMPIYLVVDWEYETVEVETRNVRIAGSLIREFNGSVVSFRIPSDVDALELGDDIMKGYLNHLNNIKRGHKMVWGRSSYIGEYNEEASDIMVQVQVDLQEGNGLTRLNEYDYGVALQEAGIVDEEGYEI